MSIRFGSNTKYDTIVTVFQPSEKTSQSGKLIVQANLSSGKNTNQTDAEGKPIYRNSNWRASFVGNAATKFKELGIVEKSRIVLTSGEIETMYVKEKEKAYTNVTIFDFELWNGNGGNNGTPQTSTPAQTSMPAPANDGFMNIPDGIEDELPFN